MTAQEKILAKNLVTSGLSSSQIDMVLAGLKDRAFFSAKCESVRHLQTAQQAVADYLGQAANKDGAITSRADAISRIMDSAKRNNLATGTDGITDPASAARAKVIVDTNSDLARGYVQHAAQSSDAARLAFPCQELIRVEPRKQQRSWTTTWRSNGGQLYGGRMIATKEDPVWVAISRFGVPYPPFDYGSGMGLREIGRSEAIRLGVIPEDYAPDGDLVQDFNQTLEADLTFKGTDDPGFTFLKNSFGDQIRYADGKIQWQADIIRAAVEQPTTVRIGRSASEAAGRLSLTIPESDFKHVVDRHIGSDDVPAEASPLRPDEMSMLPHVWRHPDRVVDRGGSIKFFEMDSADGGTYRIVVEIHPNEASFKTFYKVPSGK